MLYAWSVRQKTVSLALHPRMSAKHATRASTKPNQESVQIAIRNLTKNVLNALSKETRLDAWNVLLDSDSRMENAWNAQTQSSVPSVMRLLVRNASLGTD